MTSAFFEYGELCVVSTRGMFAFFDKGCIKPIEDVKPGTLIIALYVYLNNTSEQCVAILTPNGPRFTEMNELCRYTISVNNSLRHFAKSDEK